MKKIILGLMALGSIAAFASDDKVQSVDECLDKVENIAQIIGRSEIGIQADKKDVLIHEVSTATTFKVTLNWIYKKQSQLVYTIQTVDIPGAGNVPTTYCVIKNISLGN